MNQHNCYSWLTRKEQALLTEIIKEQVDQWPKSRIQATYPDGYDTTDLGKWRPDERTILRSMGCVIVDDAVAVD